MRNQIHPHRHTAGIQAMLDRLENLSPKITKEIPAEPPMDLLKDEMSGMKEPELLERSALINHLGALIADWRSDGMNHFDAEQCLSDAVLNEFDDGLTLRPPSEVTFISFGACAPRLATHPNASIEGFYVREIVADGEFCAEMTFVCSDERSAKIPSLRYSEAIRIASQVAVGIIPIGEHLADQDVLANFSGDKALIKDSALRTAWSHATFVLATELGMAPDLNVSFGFH